MTTPHGFAPFAVNKNIPPGANDPIIVPRAAILHVDAGNAESLFNLFRNGDGVESHFHIRKDGLIEQYRSIFRQADANLKANDFAVSIETQGFGEGEWTPQQLASIKKLLLWLHIETGGAIPLRKIRAWNGSGIGYHTLFGSPSPWTPVAKSCPGPDRKVQFEKILVPWFKVALAPKKASIRVVSFNCGHQNRHSLRANLKRLTKKRPHAVVLQEAWRLKGTIRGYVRVEAVAGNSTEAGQSVILVRNDGQIFNTYTFAAAKPKWRGPQGRVHDPRIFVGVSVGFDGTIWDILDVHRSWSKNGTKNGGAVGAEHDVIVEWVKGRKKVRKFRSIALIGDWNLRRPKLRPLAREIGGWVRTIGIDGAIVVDCKATVRRRLRKYGSDHFPVNITLTKDLK